MKLNLFTGAVKYKLFEAVDRSKAMRDMNRLHYAHPVRWLLQTWRANYRYNVQGYRMRDEA